jgi:hypothetical protein
MSVSRPTFAANGSTTIEAGYAPLVRDLALTYPQLVRQAITARLDDQALRELREVFEVAQRYFDGLYRAGGQPFTCHMVRTGSILLAEGKPLPLVEAALIHAVYDAHRYEHSTRPWPGSKVRRRRREVGSDVEEIVWAFHKLDWERIGAPEIQLRTLPRASLEHRAVLALCVANDLENHMDLALWYRTGRQFKQRIESDGSVIVRMANWRWRPSPRGSRRSSTRRLPSRSPPRSCGTVPVVTRSQSA